MSVDLKTKTTIKLQQPSMYKVVLHNDDYTPMDFVVSVLMDIFGHSFEMANHLTMEVHTRGRGIAGTYTKEIADQKVSEAALAAVVEQHPFKATAEPA